MIRRTTSEKKEITGKEKKLDNRGESLVKSWGVMPGEREPDRTTNQETSIREVVIAVKHAFRQDTAG